MGAVPCLGHTAKLVYTRYLLNILGAENSLDLIASQPACHEMEAVFHHLLKYYPHMVTSEMLLALAPAHLREIHLDAVFKQYGSSAAAREMKTEHIAGILKKCPHLERLSLVECTDLQLEELFHSAGPTLSSLVSVTLDSCGHSVQDDHIQTLLMRATNLRHLSLANTQVTDKAFLLDQHTQLSRETFSFAQIQEGRKSQQPPDHDWVWPCSLVSVDVSGCANITSTGIRHLCSLTGRSLRRLDISCTQADCTALLYLSGFSLLAAVWFSLGPESSLDEGPSLQLQVELDRCQTICQSLLAQQSAAVSCAVEKEGADTMCMKCDACGKSEEGTRMRDLKETETEGDSSQHEATERDIDHEATERDIDQEKTERDGEQSGVIPKQDCDCDTVYASDTAQVLRQTSEKVNMYTRLMQPLSCMCTCSHSVSGQNTHLRDSTHLTNSESVGVDDVQLEINAGWQFTASETNSLNQSLRCACTEMKSVQDRTTQSLVELEAQSFSNLQASAHSSHDVSDKSMCSGHWEVPSDKVQVLQHDFQSLPTTDETTCCDICDFIKTKTLERMASVVSSATECMASHTSLSQVTQANASIASGNLFVADSSFATGSNVSNVVFCNEKAVVVSNDEHMTDLPACRADSCSGDPPTHTNSTSHSSLPHSKVCASNTSSSSAQETREFGDTVPLSNPDTCAETNIETTEAIIKIGTRAMSERTDIETSAESTIETSMKSNLQTCSKTSLDHKARHDEHAEKPASQPGLLFASNIASLCLSSDCLGGVNNSLLGLSCLRAFLESSPGLQSLSIVCTPRMPLVDAALVMIGQEAPGLKHLSLDSAEAITDSGLSQLLSRCTSLSKLDLAGAPFISDAGLLPLRDNRQLEELILSESSISAPTLLTVAVGMAENLRVLDLAWCENVDEPSINQALRSCTELTRLNLRQCPVSDRTLAVIGARCMHLTTLGLSCVKDISDSAVTSLVSSLGQLRLVDLSWNLDLTDACVSALLAYCPWLHTAELSGLKRITSAPFLPIIANVGRWRRLKMLAGERCKADAEHSSHGSNTSLQRLRDYRPRRSTSYATCLQHLYLHYCDQVTDTHMEEVAFACQGALTIINYYGEPATPKIHWV